MVKAVLSKRRSPPADWNTSLSVKVQSDQPIELTVNLGLERAAFGTRGLIIPVTQEAQSATPCAAKAVTATARAEHAQERLSALSHRY